ncbi:MAG: hypothetical protein NXI15_15385 [Gammaproteobacteria bacterium]|nr:hypothetical protein [Gammaproteobacteria bacterium]
MLCLLSACGPTQVQVQGNFPSPLLDPLPITLGVWYSQEFRDHAFFDEAKGPGDSEWVVRTGQAQVQMWDALLNGMFESIVYLDTAPGNDIAPAGIDGILVPAIDELQYAIPTHTNIKVYEIWMRYRFNLLDPQGQPIAEWVMSSYGKTPTAFLQSDEQAVNLAAVMALRDAGAHFATGFQRVPVVEPWLLQHGVLTRAAPVAAP